MARRVLDEARRRRLRLVTAESCTGGLLASLLTDIPGCSHAFERGFVVYTEDAKRELLGVPAHLLQSPGPVSEEVARAMAEGALAHSHGDLAIAVTGYADGLAGPAGKSGIVHFAVARRGRAHPPLRQALRPPRPRRNPHPLAPSRARPRLGKPRRPGMRPPRLQDQ
ncbi:MAG: CinA family protein [Caulobacteraceae bacterium]